MSRYRRSAARERDYFPTHKEGYVAVTVKFWQLRGQAIRVESPEGKNAWVAVSQIANYAEIGGMFSRGKDIIIQVPEWLAKKEGFIT